MKPEIKRPRGKPPKVGPTLRYDVRLFPSDAEWGKQQPEGLSGLIRKLLEAERQKRGG